jgi:2-dehydropantoate 2-reductase
MKIAVMGTGAIGGYVGARLAAGGSQVTFIARGEHLAAIRKGGLKVLSPLGNIHVDPASATHDPAAVGEVDIVLLWDQALRRRDRRLSDRADDRRWDGGHLRAERC